VFSSGQHTFITITHKHISYKSAKGLKDGCERDRPPLAAEDVTSQSRDKGIDEGMDGLMERRTE